MQKLISEIIHKQLWVLEMMIHKKLCLRFKFYHLDKLYIHK